MATFELFSKKQRRLRGEVPDIYVYDKLPQQLKVQIIHILNDALGDGINYLRYPPAEDLYHGIHDILCREYGFFTLPGQASKAKARVQEFLLNTENTENAIDVIELCFTAIDKIAREYIPWMLNSAKIILSADEAIEELNQRFKEHGVGYQYSSGNVIRIDSTFVHQEVVKPALELLAAKKFAGANEEYLKAHEHYRHGRNKECLAECLKTVESTLKIICKGKGWGVKATDTSKKLIQICFENNLVPSFTQNQFTSLQNLLESGVPSIRNKLGGHGQGEVVQKVDDGITRYALNLTGANIIFLIEQSGLK